MSPTKRTLHSWPHPCQLLEGKSPNADYALISVVARGVGNVYESAKGGDSLWLFFCMEEKQGKMRSKHWRKLEKDTYIMLGS